jgi:hypothetical protein
MNKNTTYSSVTKMGQYWNIVCMDKRQSSGHQGKMGEILLTNIPNWLVNLLTTCNFPRLTPLPIKPTEIYKTKTFSYIEELPIEIQDMICSYLRSTDDVLCFALSCYRFLEIGRRNLITRQKHIAPIAPWAGERIICVGDYAHDYPEGFLTQQEESEITDNSEEYNLYYYAEKFKRPVLYEQLDIQQYRRAYLHVTRSGLNVKLIKELLPINKPVYGKSSRSILCNLSTNEYIRASDISESSNFGFGHILLLQICWSSDPSMSIFISYENNSDIHRGPWAGNRFNITSIEHVDDTWKDVSKQVLKKLQKILEDNSSLS